jgi:putative spermidine/putrescine transport system permease protein
MRLGRRALIAILIAPLGIEVLYLLLPFAVTFRESLFTFGRISGIHYTTSWLNYDVIVHDPFYVRVWINTLRVSSESAALTVIAAALVSWVLWNVGGRYRAYLTVVILTPLLVSGIVRAYGWIAMIGPDSVFDRASQRLGFGPLTWLYHEPAVLVGFVHVFLPFGVLMVLTRLDAIPPNVVRAAANLGANQVQIAVRVLLPQIYPVMVSAFLLIFALSMASYAVPAILGGGRVLTISQVIFSEMTGTLNWARGAALGVLLSVLTIIVMLVYQGLAARFGHRPAVVEV